MGKNVGMWAKMWAVHNRMIGMNTGEKSISQLVKLVVLFLSAIAAHGIAGGTFVDAPRLALEGIAIALALASLQSIKVEGPTLALLILLVQSSSHFILGGGTYLNSLQMTFGHLASGMFSYVAIGYFDLAWDFLATLFMGLFPLKIFPTTVIQGSNFVNARQINFFFQIKQLTASLTFRGPPWIGESNAA